MYSTPTWSVRGLVAIMVVVACGGIAGADSITASYTYQTQPLNSPQPVNFNALFGLHNNTSTIAFLGTRQDQPAGPGVDIFVPPSFMAYCVELGEPLNVPATHTHPNVFPLLGSTTQAGGLSGPVFFDATRTTNMERLWTNFSYLVQLAPSLSPAFQLAVWEVAFDDDMTLQPQLGGRFWVDVGQMQPGTTDIAEQWLSDIRNGAATAQSSLFLLSRNGSQDLITTPEPSVVSMLGLSVVVLFRRRLR
ncbi:MAG: hypothetical protein AABZ08_12550 [Planctomycetota bacterium]